MIPSRCGLATRRALAPRRPSERLGCAMQQQGGTTTTTQTTPRRAAAAAAVAAAALTDAGTGPALSPAEMEALEEERLRLEQGDIYGISRAEWVKLNQPARYLGNEFGSVHKPWDDAEIRFALTYPEEYSVGMSALGHIVLYGGYRSRPTCGAHVARSSRAPTLSLALRASLVRSFARTFESGGGAVVRSVVPSRP